MAKILVVDDHALFRLGVCTALKLGEHPSEVVGDVGTAHECLEYLKSDAPKPDILLLDIILFPTNRAKKWHAKCVKPIHV